MLTLALTKGRILKETLPLLSKVGIEPAEDIELSRKLQFDTNDKNLRLIILRGSDVSTYCLLYTSPSPRDATLSRMPSSA